MKRHDQILDALAKVNMGITGKQIAEELDTAYVNIAALITELSQKRFILAKGNSTPYLYEITQLGRDYMASDEFGKEGRAPRTPAAEKPVVNSDKPAPDADDIQIGVFTDGRLHIIANGKEMKLNAGQSAKLVNFVSDLPAKLFSGKAAPTMGSLPGRRFGPGDD